MTLFEKADYCALLHRRAALMHKREQARFAHAKREKIERQIQECTTAMLRIEMGEAA